MEQNYYSFRKYAVIFLSIMTALMIGYPFALSRINNPLESYSILILSIAAGSLIGYRRRNSALFLYFCMIAVIVLAILISNSFKN